MIKMCGPAILKPLAIILKQYFGKGGVFPSEWKKGNIVRIHKKVTNKL